MLSDTEYTAFSMVNRQGFSYKAYCAILELQGSVNTAWNF